MSDLGNSRMGAFMDFSKAISKLAVVAGFGVLGLLGSDNAQALGTSHAAPATITVGTTVTSNCSMDMTGTSLSMTAFDYTTGASASTSLLVNCSAGAPWELTFNGGARGDSTMIRNGGTELMSYAVSGSVAPAPLVAHPATGGTIAGTGIGGDQTVNLAASTPGGSPVAGQYDDTITVLFWY